MAKSRKSHSPATRGGAGAGDTDYTVGYGKPPKSGQFKKGESGNGGGGSAKVRARKADGNGSILDQMMLREAKRKIPITDNGVRSEITTYEAAARKLAISAAKGDRASQREYFDRVQSALERDVKERMARFGLLAQYVQAQFASHRGAVIVGSTPVWPNPDDVVLNYEKCIGEVRGPIDAKQAEPFIALVDEYRVWQARLEQVLETARQSSGELKTLFEAPVVTITRLLSAIRDHLPPSFKVQLDWEDAEIPVGALDIEGLNDGETVNLALIAPDGNEMAYAVFQLVSGAIDASKQVRERAKLNIAANTTSLINRLQIERQNRDGGAPPAPAVPGFDQFYSDFATEGQDSGDEVAP